MAKFYMFGKYTTEALKGISGGRTKNAVSTVEKLGGKVVSMDVLLGEKDLVFVVNFPGIQEAIKASIALSKLTGIGFSTSPALSVEEFDKLVS